MSEIETLRRAYARYVYFTSGADDPRLEAALAKVPREVFMGPGPWKLPAPGASGGYRETPDADPQWLYHDALIGLIPEKALNNGMPSFLTFLVGLGRAQAGEHAVHIGAGVGYYTAFLAELVGEDGRVTAIEYEPALAARAVANLAPYPQVRAIEGDGSSLPLDPADVILVNAGASRPLDLWLDALKPGGRLVLPLCTRYQIRGLPMTQGGIFLIKRDERGFAAAYKSATGIYPCFGADDEASEASLTEGYRKGGMQKVRRLVRTEDVSDEACWAKGPGWALTYE